MAKSLLLNILVDVLGKYVEGLTNENLKLGVFSGKIEFHNLNLKDSALDDLNLPIQVKKGSLKSLKVKVPWTQLESKPVEVSIDGVYLLACPLDLTQCTPDVSKKMVFASKEKKLKALEDSLMLTLSKDASEDGEKSIAQSASYLQQLGTCILDNLEVSLTNVHIRYEDAYSDVDTVFCAGITLDEILLTTSDETWTAKFVKRDAATRSSTAIHKIGKMNNCGVYWNSDAQSHAKMSNMEWEEVMQSLIYKQNEGVSKNRRVFEETQYVLAPPNNLTVKLTHRETCNETTPNVDIAVEISTLPFKVDKDQFRQAMLMLKSFSDLDRKRQMALYRPATRPKRNVSAKEWWHYAYRLVTGRDHSVSSKMKMMIDCCKAKDRYVQMQRQNIVAAKLAQAKGIQYKSSNEEELTSIEERLPLSVLLIFREEAVRLAIADLQLQQKQQQKPSQKSFLPSKMINSSQLSDSNKPVPEKTDEKKSFFSGWFSKSKNPKTESGHVSPASPPPQPKAERATTEEEEDLRLMSDLESKFQQLSTQSSAAIDQIFSFRLSVTSSATLELTYNRSPIAMLHMGMQFDMEMRYSNMKMKFNLQDFLVNDLCSSNPYNRTLVCMAPILEFSTPEKKTSTSLTTTKQKKSPFELTFDITKTRSDLRMDALPLLITWNKNCIQQLLAFVIVATADNSFVNSNRMLRNSMNRYAAEAALPQADFAIAIRIEAPKLIIPEDEGNSERCCIFDAGTLYLQGLMNATGMTWDVSLTKINVTMPFSRDDVSRMFETKSDVYLLQPFDVNVKVQTTDQTTADLSVWADVSPGINANFNAQKIVRLAQAAAEVINSVDISSVEARTKKKVAGVGRRSSMISLTTPQAESMPVAKTTAASGSVDKFRINVFVEFVLERMCLRLALSDNHFAELTFTGIRCGVAQRCFDQTVNFTLESVSLIDSQRMTGFEHFILAQSTEESRDLNYLFSLSLQLFNSKSSPDYEDSAMSMNMTFSVIQFFVDANTLLSYKVLVDQLLTAFNLYFKGFDSDRSSTKVTNATVADREVVKKQANPLGGMSFALAMERVSLHLLNTNARAAKTGTMFTEIAFSIHMNALRVNLNLDELFDGTANLHSLELIDVRAATQSQKLRKMLGSDIYNCESPDDYGRPLVPTNNKVLDVKIIQKSLQSMEVQVLVGHVTILIALEVVMDLATLLMDDINALLEVVNSFSMDTRSKEVLNNFSMVDSGLKASTQGQMLLTKSQSNKTDEQQEGVEPQEFFFHMSVTHPQLILIEDPCSFNSRAVVSRCKVDVMYRRILKPCLQSIDEVAHVVIEDSEIFVVGDMQIPNSKRRIVHPMTLEVHSNNRMEKGIMLEMKSTISSTADILIRISLNDLLLISSIGSRMAKRELVEELQDDYSKLDDKKSVQPIAKEKTDSVALSKTDITVYNIKSSISRVQIILINDYDGQNTPLLRLEAADADFTAAGPMMGFFGDATIFLRMDYFNVGLHVWEPVIEKFNPGVTLVKDSNGLEISFKSLIPMQINITGTLLKCIMSAASFLSSNDTVQMVRHTPSSLQICNQLGVDIDLLDANKESILLSLVDSELHSIPESTSVSNFEYNHLRSDWSRPKVFTICFGGELEKKYSPVKQLSSMSMKRPRLYHLQPTENSTEQRSFAVAPITVEMYQYQRYNITTRNWEAPWIRMGDPHEFADALGKCEREIRLNDIQLPPDWAWVDSDWCIDLTGVSTKETDGDGWEYATSFSFFSITSARRTQLATDYVRRRRWFRKRVYQPPQSSSGDEDLSGSLIVWEVVSKPDETKEIVVRTPKLIVNDLPVAVEVGMGSTFKPSRREPATIVIGPGQSLGIPLKYADDFFVRLRPAGNGCTWSEEIPVIVDKSSKQSTFSSKQVMSETRDGVQFAIWTVTQIKDGLLTVTCMAPLEIHNRLPCCVTVGFKNTQLHSESISLTPGNSNKLMNVRLSETSFSISIGLGIYRQTNELQRPRPSSVIENDWQLFDASGDRFIVCSIRVKTDEKGSLSVTVYSKILAFDSTGLECVLKSTVGDRLFEAVTYSTEEEWSSQGVNSLVSSDYWIYGVNGLTLFQALSKKMQIALNRGKVQLREDINIDSLSASKTRLDIVDPVGRKYNQYSICMNLKPYPVAPDLSQMLCIMPAFYIVNAVQDRSISLAQANGDGDRITIPAGTSMPLHGQGRNADWTQFYFCTEEGDWSIGTVNINDIGTSVLALPRKNCGGPDGRNPIVLNIDVRFAAADVPALIAVTIWESKIWRDQTNALQLKGAITLSIRNDANVRVVARQNKVDAQQYLRKQNRLASETEASKFELVVLPSQWTAFGWCDQDANSEIELFVVGEDSRRMSNSVVLNMNKVGEKKLLVEGILVQVHAGPHGKFVHVQPVTREALTDNVTVNVDPMTQLNLRKSDIVIKVQLEMISLSVIADKPVRREFLALHLQAVQFNMRHVFESAFENAGTDIAFSIGDAQADNYSESVVYPVLLSVSAAESANQTAVGNATDSISNSSHSTGSITFFENPFLQFSLEQESPKDQILPILKRVAFRILEARVSIDSASIFLFITDVFADLMEGARPNPNVFHIVNATDAFNRSLIKKSNSPAIDTKTQYEIAKGDKIVIQNLVIHPMKLILNFTPSPYPRSRKELPSTMRFVDGILVGLLATVEDFVVRIGSFTTNDAMESLPTLMDRITAKIVEDLKRNYLQVAGNFIGSLSALGRPVGLYKKIGSGVEDFFYEPYQGLMTSPKSFVKGIGKGTKNLISGVGGGVVGSTATIVGSASGGVANVARRVVAFSGDKNFTRKQDERRKEIKMNNGGALAGFKAAGESVVSGFASGITGLVTAPVQETKKSGALGFFVGVGKGIVGVAVKPVAGVTEAISNVATGINQQFSDAVVLQQLRPRRALYRSDLASAELVLVSLDLFSALAQDFVYKTSTKRNVTDTFLVALHLGFREDDVSDNDVFGVVLSQKYLYACTKFMVSKWSIAVSELSHVLLGRDEKDPKQTGLLLFNYGQGSNATNTKFIPFANRAAAVEAYDALLPFRTVFGYPSLMEPSEVIISEWNSGERDRRESLNRSSSSALQADSTTPRESTVSAMGDRQDSINRRSSVAEKQKSERIYEFGTANRTKFTHDRMSDQQFKLIADSYFAKFPVLLPITPEKRHDYHQYLDCIVWRAISDWKFNHDTIINPSRCCACLIINHSRSMVQILDVELKEGVQVLTFGLGEGYEQVGKVIRPNGGAVVLFGYSRRPSLISQEHIKYVVHTNAFNALVSTRPNSSNLNSLLGYETMFLEKSRTDWWAKFVIAVS